MSALETMRYGRGLPVRSQEDFEVVEGLKAVKAAKEHLPTVGDHRRSLAQQRIIENESNVSLCSLSSVDIEDILLCKSLIVNVDL